MTHDHDRRSSTKTLQDKQHACATTFRQSLDRNQMIGWAIGGAVGTIAGTLAERAFFDES